MSNKDITTPTNQTNRARLRRGHKTKSSPNMNNILINRNPNSDPQPISKGGENNLFNVFGSTQGFVTGGPDRETITDREKCITTETGSMNIKIGYTKSATGRDTIKFTIRGVVSEIEKCTNVGPTCPYSDDPKPMEKGDAYFDFHFDGPKKRPEVAEWHAATERRTIEKKSCDKCKEFENHTSLVFSYGGNSAVKAFQESLTDMCANGDSDSINLNLNWLCVKDIKNSCTNIFGNNTCDDCEITLYGVNECEGPNNPPGCLTTQQIEELVAACGEGCTYKLDLLSGELAGSESAISADALCDNLDSLDCLFNEDGSLPEDAAERLAKCWDDMVDVSWYEVPDLLLPGGTDRLLESFLKCLCKE